MAIEDPMTPAQFRKWQKRMGLSTSRCATVLRVGMRQICNYRSGESGVSPTIAFLCQLVELAVEHKLVELPDPWVPPPKRTTPRVRSRSKWVARESSAAAA